MEKIDKLLGGHDLPPPENVGEGKGEYKISPETIERMYCTVFYGLSQKYGLSPTESHLTTIILSFHINKKPCYISEASFAEILRVSIQTINSSLQELERKGVIDRADRRGRKGTILWQITEKTQAHLQYIRDRIGNAKDQKKRSQY